ncbi:hypothetical protein BDV18DRAFT_44998 [Aspergillus unguis]
MPFQDKKPKSYSMFPRLHYDVVYRCATENPHFAETLNFHPFDDSRACIGEYDTQITGKFICYNPSCKKTGWGSRKIEMTVRIYPSEDSGTRTEACAENDTDDSETTSEGGVGLPKELTYNARVYHQRCHECNWVYKPKLNQSYVERVVHCLSMWVGDDMEYPRYFECEGSGWGIYVACTRFGALTLDY